MVHKRLRCVQICLHRHLLRRHFSCNHRALVRFDLRQVVLLRRGFFLHVDLRGERPRGFNLLRNLHGFDLGLFNKHVHVFLGFREFIQAVGKALDVGFSRTALV